MIKKWFSQTVADIREYYIGYKIKRLKRHADNIALKLNTEVFIIKYKGALKIVTARWFKYQRQHGFFTKDFTKDKFRETAFYSTKG
ncbi:MAG: hypothetical protein PHH37_08365 [Paludibacter sp.]|nr:hypothetical protein [Paludibacter sp.]